MDMWDRCFVDIEIVDQIVIVFRGTVNVSVNVTPIARCIMIVIGVIFVIAVLMIEVGKGL